MRCRQARRAMDRRLDDSIPLELGFQLDMHLNECAQCRGDWESALEVEEGLARLPEPPLAGLNVAHAAARVREQVRLRGAAEDPRAAWDWVGQRQVRARLAAAAAILLLLGAWHFAGSATTRESSALALARPEPESNTLAELPQQDQAGPVTSESSALPASETPEDDPVDDERLSRARNEMRAVLLAAYKDVAAGAPASPSPDMHSFAAQVDERALFLRKQSWPVLRIAERLLKDPEPDVARAAARYVGLRGDRSSIRRLSASLHHEPIADAVTLALGDAGPHGIDGLALALSVPGQRTRASELLIEMAVPAAATAVAEVLRVERQATEGTSSPELLDVLVAMQTVSLPALIHLGQTQVLDQEELLLALDEIRGAGSYIAGAIHGAGHPPRRHSEDLETLVRCAATLAPHTAGAWMDEALADRSWEAFCREQLPRVQGVAGVEILVKLDENPAVSTTDLDELFERSLAIDSGRFVEALHHWRQILVPESYATVARRMLSVGTAPTLPVIRALLESERVSAELQTDLVDFLASNGDAGDAQVAEKVFAQCNAEERQLAASSLFALHQLGGESASLRVLQDAPERDQQNILSLLRRLQTEERKTSSLYKLARELRPFLSSRALATRRSSS